MMRRQTPVIYLALFAFCSLPSLTLIADDPFSAGDPFSARTAAKPTKGVTVLSVAKPTPRSQTLAASPYRNIEAALSTKTAIRVSEMPLSQVIREISTAHRIPIFLQRRALQQAKVSVETPVTTDLRSVSLRMALNLLLSKVGLDYIVKDEVVQVTTKDVALRQPIEMNYRLKEHDEAGIERTVKSVQELLDKKHEAPQPQPVVTVSANIELIEGRRTLVVTGSYRMHALVRNYLRHSPTSDSQPVAR